jgi:hypothetical protein
MLYDDVYDDSLWLYLRWIVCDLWYADIWFMIRCYMFTNDDVWWFVVIIFKMDCLWLCLWLIYNVWDGYD